MTRLVYRFGEALPNGLEAKALLGGKGAGLAEMVRLGVPVPPGFTITTEACRRHRPGVMPEGLQEQVEEAMTWLEGEVERGFGKAAAPLLVSVRSGGPISMPGMMDTVLNLGLNDATVQGLAATSGDPRFAYDAYRRLLEMYGDVVMGTDRERFDESFSELKRSLGGAKMIDAEVPASALEELVGRYRRIILSETGKGFPDDVREQLWQAIGAVFGSWTNQRARRYRAMHDIPEHLGTAVNVQAMVFGNMGSTSGSGVLFTRSPSSGEKALYGEFLPNAQGEDVVAGIRTPRPLTVADSTPGREHESLEQSMPAVFEEIVALAGRLEAHFKDMQDIEFTIERGRLYILQTRTGKRTAQAAVRVAVAMVEEGLIDEKQAVMKVDPAALEQLLHAQLPPPERLQARGILPIASGLPASPGAATGTIVLDADRAELLAEEGKAVILVRRETSPEDIHGMKAARGIVTATGGMTSHAAVVARGLGKCCVAGASDLAVDYQDGLVLCHGPGGETVTLREGDLVTLDGTHGKLYLGELAVEATASIAELETLMAWADQHRRLRVRANADTPSGATSARALGAEGIGLCRTEHMFFSNDRVTAVRCMALASSAEVRTTWLAKIEPMQHGDFVELFHAMDGLPVTIRLLDWPLHEFLPQEDRELGLVADALGESPEEIRLRATALHETNPMLGHRGVRVGLTSPEIYRTQVRAIATAALACRDQGIDVRPEIMIPVVCLGVEVARMRVHIEEELDAVLGRRRAEIPVKIGTMVELPRACLVAGELAEHAEFFSFGTNDLTQTTFGISRDDAGHFMGRYTADRDLLDADPFARLDRKGVGELVDIACKRGRAQRPELSLGLCGEHGGDPDSIDFCEEIGLDYVSCSPPRLPVARLAAAQAAIRRAAAK